MREFETITKKIYSRRQFLGTAAAVLFMVSLCAAAERNRRPNILKAEELK